ncbi:MAG: bifunctional precorrin-2 dehydrogenase/sirohydrochlorin ferrochelatase [Desulfovibrionaceae bacterium]|nr:bifunctional precorrin-2 dehydrogenase/sirohydrochlorin ferrochelatase [Desulfovibrionaceae bacterium]
MRYYPIFVNLEDKHCLVVGAGQVGRRKIEVLLRSGAGRITVIDVNEPGPDLAATLKDERVSFRRGEFKDRDLDGKFLVIASTSSEELNWRISNLCRDRGLLCNIVDQPEKCSFIVPAMVRQGDLTLAISTGGRSPALAKRIRKDLEESFGAEYGGFLMLMGRLRPMMLRLGLETDENTAVFRSVVDSRLMEALEKKDSALARDILAEKLPPGLHNAISELLDGLV